MTELPPTPYHSGKAAHQAAALNVAAALRTWHKLHLELQHLIRTSPKSTRLRRQRTEYRRRTRTRTRSR